MVGEGNVPNVGSTSEKWARKANHVTQTTTSNGETPIETARRFEKKNGIGIFPDNERSQSPHIVEGGINTTTKSKATEMIEQGEIGTLFRKSRAAKTLFGVPVLVSAKRHHIGPKENI